MSLYTLVFVRDVVRLTADLLGLITDPRRFPANNHATSSRFFRREVDLVGEQERYRAYSIPAGWHLSS